jgi:hypothetical protein
MRAKMSAVLLWLAAGLLAFDGIMHGARWGRSGLRTIEGAVGDAPLLSKQFAVDLEVLWIGDIANLLCVAAVCALAARSARFAAPSVLLIVAIIPLSLAVLLFAAHSVWWVPALQLACAALVIAGALLRIEFRTGRPV